MKMMISIIRIFFFFALFSVVRAEDSRRVIGGDIIHKATGYGQTAEEATFKAQAEAVKSLTAECSIPSIRIIVFNKSVQRSAQGFEAQAEVGINFEDCEIAKRATDSQKKALTNPELAKDLEAYNRFIRNETKTPPKNDDLKDFIRGEFHQVGQNLDRMNDRIDNLEDKIQSPVIQVIQAPAPQGQVNPNKAMCQAQYQSLMNQAQTAALSNYPSGNLTQGQALVYYNQAQMTLKNCN